MKSTLKRKTQSLHYGPNRPASKYLIKGLKPGQFLTTTGVYNSDQSYCIGYTDDKRDKALDGWYYFADLVKI